MFIAKSAIGALLTALFFAVTGPILMYQDPGAGNPDEVAELLPAEAMFFGEFVKAPRLLKDWREYVGSFCKGEAKKRFCDQIEQAFTGILEKLPEKFKRDFEKGLPTIQRMAFMVQAPESSFPMACILTSSDANFIRTTVEENLKPFSFEEKEHQGVKTIAIRKAGDVQMPVPMYFAALGKRLVYTTDWGVMTSILDRSVGKGKGDDLRKNRLYREFTPATGDEPAFRAFATMDWNMFMDRSGGIASGRASTYYMDMVDAVIEFRKFHGVTTEATLRPGKIDARTRLHIDSPCRVYEAIRTAPGPKETLKFVPENAVMVSHSNLSGGMDVWKKVEDMLKRGDIVRAKAGEKGTTLMDTVTVEMKREVGFEAADIAAALGKEAMVALVGDDAIETINRGPQSLVAAIHIVDAAKAKDLIEKILKLGGEFDTRKEGDTVFYSSHEEDVPEIAVLKDFVVLGAKENLKAALKSGEAGGTFSKKLPEGVKTSAGYAAIKHQAIWDIVRMTGAPVPEEMAKDLNLDAWANIFVTTEKAYVQFSSMDAGIGGLAHSSFLAIPLAISFISVARVEMMTMAGQKGTAGTPVDEKPVPPMAADKLAEQVKVNVENLRSDDLAARDTATQNLKALGRQAVPLLVDVAKKETDPEARARVIRILMDWRAFDAWPELLTRKVDAFFSEFTKATAEDEGNPWNALLSWPRNEGDENTFRAWSLEPYRANAYKLQGLENRDVLEIPQAIQQLATKLTNDKVSPAQKKNLAMLFAIQDASLAGDAILAALKDADAELKRFLYIALGWSKNPKAREVIFAGFKDADRYVSRASFIAADKMKDGAPVPKLIELLREKDPEIRWNASFTLRMVTNGKLFVNVYLPDDDFNAAVASAMQWWEKNKDSFKK